MRARELEERIKKRGYTVVPDLEELLLSLEPRPEIMGGIPENIPEGRTIIKIIFERPLFLLSYRVLPGPLGGTVLADDNKVHDGDLPDGESSFAYFVDARFPHPRLRIYEKILGEGGYKLPEMAAIGTRFLKTGGGILYTASILDETISDSCLFYSNREMYIPIRACSLDDDPEELVDPREDLAGIILLEGI